jgi:hypothetical protein
VLILKGKNTAVNGLELDGKAVLDSSVTNFVKIDESVPIYVPVEPTDQEYLQIRGFKLRNN